MPVSGALSVVTSLVHTNVARWLLTLLALVLAGCAATPPSSSSPSAPTSLLSVLSPEASPSPTPSPDVAPPTDRLLPETLGGVELHTFAVGEDILKRLAARLHVGIDDFEVRYASEHGARFLQMYAVRVHGTGGERLVRAWLAVAYPPDVLDVAWTERRMAGRTVVELSAPSAAARIGSFHLYALADTLLVVQAFDPNVAAEALAVLP
jgi:hypothetical protein